MRKASIAFRDGRVGEGRTRLSSGVCPSPRTPERSADRRRSVLNASSASTGTASSVRALEHPRADELCEPKTLGASPLPETPPKSGSRWSGDTDIYRHHFSGTTR